MTPVLHLVDRYARLTACFSLLLLLLPPPPPPPLPLTSNRNKKLMSRIDCVCNPLQH
jgi:hypothetical protein